ncbi:hypothetical protein AALP_AA2G135800 [Arabis alpina]|uniref:Uncharacterized protein n=1 Tax=Arabis alpina TaxID=50452 RepID=A0A087HH74_ARAAL|nr:hypothetical protein AALP_AA2G135800 [Arabis alpina]
MDSYQQRPPYMGPPSGPPHPADPYHQYFQHPARPPGPPPTQPGGPAWYPNQFHNPHSPSPPPPPPPPPQPQGRQPSPHFPQGEPYSSYPTHSHQPPFNAAANGNSQFHSPAGPPLPPPHPQANQEWENQNWGCQQGHASQANSNVEDWAVKARNWAANENQQSAPNPPSEQVYQQYHNHGYQQFPVPPTTQQEMYTNYATGNESFPGGSSAGLSHQENLPTGSVNHQQEVPYSYSSVAGKEESGNATQQEVQISVPNGGGPVHVEQQMQYAYGDQTAPHSNVNDQPLQFATRESSDYASIHNAWPPHAATGVVYPPIPSSHDTSMAMPPVSGHTMPPFGRFPPQNNLPVGPPYAFATKPPLHPVAAFMDDSYATASVPPKKPPVPNWLKEELLKNKATLGRPSSGSFEEKDSMDDDVVYNPPAKVDQHDDKSFSPSKSSDEEEDEDDEMDADRAATIHLEIKRILTEVLLKVTDELFDEIATKVINEDGIPKDNSVQHNQKSSSSLISAADPMPQASAKILVAVGGVNKKPGSGSPADVLGLGSYASDDDDADADTDAASNTGVDGSDGVESLGMELRNDVNQHPSTEKLPEPKAMVNARLDPEVELGDMSPKNNNSGLDQMLGSKRNDDEGVSNKNLDISASSGVDDDISGSRTNHPDRTVSDKDAILDEPHMKNSGLNSDCNLRQDSNGKDLSDDVSRDRSRTEETKAGKEKIDSQNGSKDRLKQNDMKPAEKVKGFESNKRSSDLHVKKDSRDSERPHKSNSKEDRGKKREKEKEEERSRHRQAEDSSKDKRRRTPTSNGSSDDSARKSRSRRRNISPSPVRSRRKRSSPSSDESSDDSRRKSSSRRRNRSPSPGRSKRRHVSSRSPHSKHSQRKNTVHSSHDTSRSKRSRSRSPRRRHRA